MFKRKLLITGSSGYVGKSFIKRYSSNYIIETFSLEKCSMDTIDFSSIDAIIHAAALVHQKKELNYEKYQEINVDYPLSLARKSKLNGVKQFVFISSIAVYGEDEVILDENTTCNPITSYGKSKLEAEKQLLKLNDDSFIVSIIRAPMIYGKNAPGNIDSLVKLITKVPFLPFGKITNKRSFVYIGNLCHMIETVIERKKSGVFLASDCEAVSTTRLIELIADGLDRTVWLAEIPLFESLLKLLKPSLYKRLYGSLVVNNEVTRRNLDFTNKFSVEDGIKFMIQGEKND